jgi:hypothetical protein
MSEKSVKKSRTEESIVAKVAELMETLDEIKKYDVLERHFKKFSLIVLSSIVISILIQTFLPFSNLLAAFSPPQQYLLTFPLVLIPNSGIVIGILYVRRKINTVKTGEWKEELSHGFPSALKILSEINWDASFKVVTSGELNYIMYGIVKGASYWIITYFTLGFAFNLVSYTVLNETRVFGGASLWISLLITFVYLKNDLSKRFSEIRSIDKLHWELRRFSYELRKAEF